MARCRFCLLTDHIPGVRLDTQGVCQYCRQGEQSRQRDRQQRAELKAKFSTLARERAGQAAYDCVVAFSGGKDSSYTLYLMREVYHLRPLAMSFDNWFQSERALWNVRQVAGRLNVEQVTVRPGFRDFQEVVRLCLKPGLFPRKAMQRASAVCTLCLSMIRASAFKLAIEKRIPFVVFGLSPGQAPVSTAVFKTHPAMLEKMQSSLQRTLETQLSFPIARYFLQQDHLQQAQDFPYSINPLVFEEYEEQKIFDLLRDLGWKPPEDTDANSTNCLLNTLANQIHLQQYGFNPYIFELSELIRHGSLARREALERLSSPVKENILEKVEHKLCNEAHHGDYADTAAIHF